MKKLIDGIVEFRNSLTDEKRDLFAKLALGQKPDALFIACSDSRVVPNLFASTNPGDIFVYRNIGNIVPAFDVEGEESSKAALEFSLHSLHIQDIVVCGHSECGAMIGLCHQDILPKACCSVERWLQHARKALENVQRGYTLDPTLSLANQVSQMNVLLQMQHLLTYPEVSKRIALGTLRIHGWWFDIAKADVYYYDSLQERFLIIEESVKEILLHLASTPLSQAQVLV